MDKKDWAILIIALILVILVIVFWDEFIVRENKLISMDYCETNDDCVWGVDTSVCCIAPRLMNKEIVESDEDYVIYEEGVDYLRDYPKKQNCFTYDGKLSSGCIVDHLFTYKEPLNCLNNKCEVSV